MSHDEMLKKLFGGKWKEIDGPDSGVGIDHWCRNEQGEEAYINDDQGFLTIQKDGETVWSGDEADFDEIGK